MPIEPKPLFRPDVLRGHLGDFNLPPATEPARLKLVQWASLIRSGQVDALNERELLPDFLTDLFVALLGYMPAPGRDGVYTFSREQHVQVEGQFADAAIGRFTAGGTPEFVLVVEGKGPRDPLERPHAGRRMSAVDQGYKYSVNLPCDWIVITNIRQTRLYFKGADQQTYERFDTERLAVDPVQLKKLVFLLGAPRVLRTAGRSHLYDLMAASDRAGRELTKAFYRTYAEMRHDAFEQVAVANPTIDRHVVLTATQKVLDRLLFVAFSEDRGLLPALTIQKAYQHNDPYNPRPIWENFKGLFASIDRGNERLAIPKYNGGLFASDLLLDGLTIPDAVFRQLHTLGDYDYRPASEAAIDPAEDQGTHNSLVDVDILGHIFEQSISDLERLRNELDGIEPPAGRDKHLSRRKREGAFYTPAFITRYIVEQALGGVLKERFEALRVRHEAGASRTVKPLLADPNAYDRAALKPAGQEALLAFWHDWQQELGTVRLLDPSCGSGAFLVEAFDQLYAAYETTNDRLADLRGERLLFDLDKQILQNNLYGVDLNDEAVEICRLSLWIKTAQKGKELTSLDHTIRVGNSVVDEQAVHPRAFDWKSTFPEVFAAGGFDVVVGNPPYVRQELLGAIKPHLESRFASYHGMADLYVYFYELGLRVLRPGGKLSLIVTNKWLKAGYAEPLRKHLGEASWVESLVDFGHAKQIFEDADVFPCILVAQKPVEGRQRPTPRGAVIPREQLRIDDLSRQIEQEGHDVDGQNFGPSAWQLEPPGVGRLIARIAADRTTLTEFAGVKPIYGVKTGCNEAFLIDSAKRAELVANDPNSADLLKPYLRGQDVDRWITEWAGLWMILARKGIDIERYPAIAQHLTKFRPALEPKPVDWRGTEWPGRAAGSHKWYELQTPVENWREFARPKIVYQEIQFHPSYAFDDAGLFGNNKIFFIPTGDLYLLAVLNSPLMWWYNWRNLPHMKDEALTPVAYRMEVLPIARPSDDQRGRCEVGVRRLIEIMTLKQSAAKLIHDWLKVEFEVGKPTLKLQAPADLDANVFVAEVKKSRGKGTPLTAAALKALRDEYTRTLVPARAAAAEAVALEHQLADLVNAAYGLTPEDVALMWHTAPPRMPFPPTTSR